MFPSCGWANAPTISADVGPYVEIHMGSALVADVIEAPVHRWLGRGALLITPISSPDSVSATAAHR